MKYLPELKNPASERVWADHSHSVNVCIRAPTVSYWGKNGEHRSLGLCSRTLCLNSLASVAAMKILKISEESYKEHTYNRINTNKGTYLSKSHTHHGYGSIVHCWRQQVYCPQITLSYMHKKDSNAYVLRMDCLLVFTPLIPPYKMRNTLHLWSLCSKNQRQPGNFYL